MRNAVPQDIDSTAHRALSNLILVLFAGIATAGVLTSTPLQSANDRSRWSTVWSLVERGTYQIDEIDRNPSWYTIDKVRHRESESEDYHFYSTKPQLLPTLTAGVYWGVKRVTGLGLFKSPRRASRIILLVVNVLPMLVALIYFARLLERHSQNRLGSLFVLATACFGTLLTPFLNTLNNHTVAATGVILAICFASRILLEESARLRDFALTGFFAAWACCNELPAALFGVAFFLLMFRADAKRTFTAFVPGALIPLAGFFVTVWIATGGWKPFYMFYGTEKYVYTHQGVPSYWSNPQGLDANTESPIVYAFHCLAGHHGILSLTPIFFLTLLGVLSPRTWKHPFRAFVPTAIVLTLVVLGFYLTRTKNYNYGGTSAGLRWAFWLIPFWLLALAPLVEKWWSSRRLRTLMFVLLAVSIGTGVAASSNPWSHPWLYNFMERNGIVSYQTSPPEMSPRRSLIAGLPEVDDGQRLRVTYRSDSGGEMVFFVANMGSGSEISVHRDGNLIGSARVNVQLIEAGEPPDRYIEKITSGDRGGLIRILCGLPNSSRFNPRRIRHIDVPGLDGGALGCVHATAEVLERSDESRWYRCELWSADTAPFGLVQFRQTQRIDRTGEIRSVETWVLDGIETANLDDNPPIP